MTKLRASYDFDEGDGFLYTLSKEALRRRGLQSIDLSSVALEDLRPRFHVQRAWLVGVLHGDLASDCITASIKAPRHVFRDFASAAGLNKTLDVFPGRRDDRVLELLMTLPWTEIKIPDDSRPQIDFYHQSLELPEYEDSFTKHNPPYVAFYKSAHVTDHLAKSDIDFFDAPDEIIFASAELSDLRFPTIVDLVRQSPRHVVFEIDNLVRQPGNMSSEYVKGIAVTKCDDDTFCVADFVVDHPGRHVTGWGINMGWHYRIGADEKWCRVVSSNDCPCNNPSRHEHHLSALTIVEAQLTEKPSKITKQRPSAQPVQEASE